MTPSQSPLSQALRCAALLTAGLFAACGAAQASPVTYRFEMPGWAYLVPAATFGSHAILDVTLDNGGSNWALQSYLNSDIRKLRVHAAGGSLDVSFTHFSSFTDGLSASFISTDASGNALLDLLARRDDASGLGVAIYGTEGMGWVQLARMTPTGGLTTFAVSPGGEAGIYQSAYTDVGFTGVALRGVLLEGGSVPEPSSWALGGLALAAAAGARRRRRA